MILAFQVFWLQKQMHNVLINLPSSQVVHWQTLVLGTQLQMRGVLGYKTVLNSQVVLCATVESSLGPLLFMSATPAISWRVPGWENARVMETGVALFHSVLLVSRAFNNFHASISIAISVHASACTKGNLSGSVYPLLRYPGAVYTLS